MHYYLDPHDIGKKVVQAIKLVGAGVIGVLVARQLLRMLGDDENS